MLILRIRRRESYVCASELICKLSHLILSRDVFPLKLSIVQNPNLVPLRIRCFGSSRPTHNTQISVVESTQPLLSLTPTNRISRVARSEGQGALFEYLHCTRGFHCTDAEHVSKNSPYFLERLLSKVENEQDVSRALTRFLRYNPINEFEPFLESLGLTPFEVVSLLPQSLMFLNDDQVMLDNFHILCGYGVPRSKIGRIYKEAIGVFRYEYGILDSKLRAYEELGLSKSTVIKLVSCCPSLLVGNVNKELIGVLEKLKAWGFGNDWIGGYLSCKSTYNWNRMLETMGFLGEVGYSQTQMGSLFKTNPGLLLEGSGKRIYSLVGGLLKLDLKMSEIYSFFLQNPQILSAKCAKNVCRAVCFLYEIGMEAEGIATIVANNIRALGGVSLNQTRTILKKLEVERDTLCLMIKEDPLTFLSLVAKSDVVSIEQLWSGNQSRFVEKNTFLLKLGYVENSDEMTKALKKFRGRGDQLQERFDCLVQAGLDPNVVANMIKHAPSVLNQSKDILEKKIDCLRNCLGYPLESIEVFPSYLGYDLGRINLRFSMCAWLRERGKAKPTLSLSTVLVCSEARFFRDFVERDPEGPTKWESLKKSLPSS
ncbi:hypothetical protein RHMOL_Rhmol13G0145600 [Rhododendron molle]|uniref:Uncharacterized protein n=1 Tax=Rhododendron molle TaxID=49168 RepID=A0ACC0L6K0_RHOML|nr:hypothetical protein RHMOL_Rhmol13G0145600 [Rhododendron molle]